MIHLNSFWPAKKKEKTIPESTAGNPITSLNKTSLSALPTKPAFLSSFLFFHFAVCLRFEQTIQWTSLPWHPSTQTLSPLLGLLGPTFSGPTSSPAPETSSSALSNPRRRRRPSAWPSRLRRGWVESSLSVRSRACWVASGATRARANSSISWPNTSMSLLVARFCFFAFNVFFFSFLFFSETSYDSIDSCLILVGMQWRGEVLWSCFDEWL